jgi:hypothetical protein
LGRRLVDELGPEPSVDTLGRWMAHYIAELMRRAEDASGLERAAAERDCMDAILRLWAHRAAYPGERPPLGSFAPILRTLASLGDDRRHRYFTPPRQRSEGKDTAGEWLDVAEGIDAAARALIRFCIARASAAATDQEIEWVKVGLPLAMEGDSELPIVRILVREADLLGGEIQDPADPKARELAQTKRELDGFVETCRAASDLISQALGDVGVDGKQAGES